MKLKKKLRRLPPLPGDWHYVANETRGTAIDLTTVALCSCTHPHLQHDTVSAALFKVSGTVLGKATMAHLTRAALIAATRIPSW